MKHEIRGQLILEFVGLRSKMYSILNVDGANKKTAKGVITQVKNEQISHEDFKTSLFEKKTFIHRGTKIVQDKHQLCTADVTKVTLSPFNDKKWKRVYFLQFWKYQHNCTRILFTWTLQD